MATPARGSSAFRLTLSLPVSLGFISTDTTGTATPSESATSTMGPAEAALTAEAVVEAADAWARTYADAGAYAWTEACAQALRGMGAGIPWKGTPGTPGTPGTEGGGRRGSRSSRDGGRTLPTVGPAAEVLGGESREGGGGELVPVRQGVVRHAASVHFGGRGRERASHSRGISGGRRGSGEGGRSAKLKRRLGGWLGEDLGPRSTASAAGSLRAVRRFGHLDRGVDFGEFGLDRAGS